jgi:2-polyprenyl-3-methyl-5-hydroxy-6-metoxy-1,4-benzoquinol methylase
MEPSANDFDAPATRCCLCNSPEIFHFKTDYRGMKVFKCRNCKIRFLNPLPGDKWLFETYTGYKEHNPDKMDKSILISRGIKHEFNISQVEKYTTAGRFFSVGCGNGVEIMVAKKRGWIAEGYEINEEWAKQLSKLHSADIYSSDFIRLPVKEENYDCLYINHVIEHLKEPHNYIKKMYNMLKPGGILYIGTPNINGLANRIKGLADNLGLRKNIAKYYGTKQHLFYYTPASLKFVLEKYYGFRVLFMNNDLNMNKRTKRVSRNIFDRLCYTTSFRLMARKI